MNSEDVVREHYQHSDLERRVVAALHRKGIELDALRVEDLAGLDQLHAGGVATTEHLLDSLELSAETTLLDVGAGVGGPARLAAARHGCRVTGIDLSPDFVSLATNLTERVGLARLVSYQVGSVLALPFDDGAFDRAMLNHVGMNIAEKGAMFAEVRRVLVPGGLFALYEQMRTGDGALTYPLPWADDERSSFVARREEYAQLLESAGFAVERDESLMPVIAATGPPPPGALGPADLFGPGFDERIGNNLTATFGGILSPVLIVARAV